MKPDATIIIPVLNNHPFTVQCVESIRKETQEVAHEVIVVDNGSRPAVRGFLPRGVRVIRNGENRGFGGACNQGARAARGRHLVFLNNDTVVQPGWLKALVDRAEADPTAGAVGAKLVYPDGKLQEAGGIIWSDGNGWNYGRGDDPRHPRYNFVREVDYASAACLLVRRDLFRRLGGFDPRYGLGYGEDSDLCFAIRKAGFRVLYEPRAEVVHFEGMTGGRNPDEGIKALQRENKEKLFRKWRRAMARQPEFDRSAVPAAATRGRKKSILVVDPLTPMYDRSSGSLRIWNVLKHWVSRGHHVAYVARNAVNQDRYVAECRALGVEVYPTDPERYPPEDRPRLAARPIDWEDLLGSRSWDLAYLSFWHIAEVYAPMIRARRPETRIVVDSHDLHFRRLEQALAMDGGGPSREEVSVLRERELAVYREADGVVVVTPEERAAIQALIPGSPVYVIPGMYRVDPRPAPFEKRDGLLYVGNFPHVPNVDAVLWFVREVFPRLTGEFPELRLWVVGTRPPDEIRRLHGRGPGGRGEIIVSGAVPDTAPFLRQARVSIAPVRYGAGMIGKVAEAMAAGTPVVTTPIGASGVGAVNGRDLLTAERPEDFAAAVGALLRNRALWRRLQREGRARIRMRYTPERVAGEMDRIAAVAPAGAVRGAAGA